jgi:GTP-binding protein Era
MVSGSTTQGSVPPPREHVGRVALVGRPNVGKSTLLNVLVDEKIAIVSPHPQTTRQRLLGVRTDETSQMVFVDTPGLQLGPTPPRHRLGVRMQHEALEALRDADLVLVVADARTPPDEELLAKVPKGAVLALNKIDLVKPRSRLLASLEAWSKAHDFAAIVPISAKTQSGLRGLVREIRDRLPAGEPLFDDDTLTDKPARFLAAEVVREQILVRTRDEIPHGIAVTVDRFDELGKRGTRIALTVHVPKESHKKIVIGRGGALLKAAGTAARRDLSRLLGGPVHVSIWVRVTPDWVDDPKALGELGFES